MKSSESDGARNRARRLAANIVRAFLRMQKVYHCRITFADLVWQDVKKQPQRLTLFLQALLELAQDPPNLGRPISREYPADFIYTKQECSIYYDYVQKPRTINVLLIAESSLDDRVLQTEHTIAALLSWVIPLRLKFLRTAFYILYTLIVIALGLSVLCILKTYVEK